MKRVLIVLFLLIRFASNAQAPHFNTIELVRKNENVQINIIYPDRVGYLWLGTNKGLFRFDGTKSIQFNKSDGLTDDNVTAIGQDSLDRIWIGQKNGELFFLEKNKITKFDPSEGTSTALISDILFDHQGNLWFSTHGDGLYYYRNERLYRIDENEGLKDLFFYDLEEDSQGRIWAGSDGGIAICTLQDTKVNIQSISTIEGLPDDIIHKIKQDKDGTFWLGTEDAGIVHYLPTTKTFEGQEQLGLKPVNDFLLEGNNIWLATQSTGVILYDKVLKTFSVFDQGLPAIDVLAEDREGNVWFGSKKGLYRSYGNHISFLDLKDELSDDNVFALALDSKNDLWISTQEGLFIRHATANGRFEFERPLKGTPYDKFFFISLYADPEGYIWAGSYGQGLLRINTVTKSIKYFNKELLNGNVLGITGKDQTVWLATLGGATKIQWKDQAFDIVNMGSKDGLSSDYIYQVFIDSQQRVWLATDGKGVDMIDKGRIQHFPGSISSKVVYGFAEDKNHTIWANIQHEGLYQMEGNTFQLRNDSTLLDLRNTEIGALANTQLGNLIMMNDFGLEVFDVQKQQRHYLGTASDFLNMQPNLNATAKDQQGNIYFGTEAGIIVYNGGIQNLPSTPTAYIESLKVSNQMVEIENGLDFNHQDNNITFNYVGFWFQNPEGINFKYKLENYDHEWIESRDRAATYSNLPPGDYTFKLKASDEDSFISSEEASIHFVISPPFWRTYWFYFLSVVALIVAGSSFIRYREKKLLADKHELEEKVKERTAEILKMNHEIRQQAEEIRAINDNLEKLVLERTNELNRKNQALQEAAFINAHNLRSPVASILGLVNLISKLKWADEDKEYIHHLEQSANRLDEIVSTISEAIEKGDDPPSMDDTDFAV